MKEAKEGISEPLEPGRRYVDRDRLIEKLGKAALTPFEDLGLLIARLVVEDMPTVTMGDCDTCVTRSGRLDSMEGVTVNVTYLSQCGCDTKFPVKTEGVTVSHISEVKTDDYVGVCACAHKQGRSPGKV